MNDFILTYQNDITTILSNNVFFNLNKKPQLSFNFDTLICESPTNVYFRTLGDNQFILTEKEILECKNICDNFYNLGDYNVYAYDPNDDNIYKGYIKKSECKEKNYKYIIDKSPEKLSSFYDENTEKWIPFYAAITEEGNLIENINLLNCSKCVLFLTKEQFDKFPKKERNTDKWDFKKEIWVDKRDLKTLKEKSILYCRNLFERLRWKSNTEYIPQFEQYTWFYQVQEAKEYLSNLEKLKIETKSPYIDSFLLARMDDHIPSKKDLAINILENHYGYLQKMAVLNAHQWLYIDKIKYATSCLEVDNIKKEIKEYYKNN